MNRIPIAVFVASILLLSSTVSSREPEHKNSTELRPRIHHRYGDAGTAAGRGAYGPQRSTAAETYVLGDYTFDGPAGVDAQGWITRERYDYVVLDTFFHVADTTGLDGGDIGRLIVLEGSQSVWCGVTAGDPRCCSYASLPGYGNSWLQYFESVKFPHTGDVELSYLTIWDIEPAEDYAYVEYLDKDDYWQVLTFYSWYMPGEHVKFESLSMPDSLLADSVQVRFRFTSDGAWSDEDGLWPTDGAIIIDSLRLADAGGEIDFQDFEIEAPGARATSDGFWQSSAAPARGNFGGLFPGTDALQEDPCFGNATSLWGFFKESTYNYACGGHPEQPAVPLGLAYSYYNSDFVSNEIWSPWIDWDTDIYGSPVPSGAESAVLELDVYRDLPIINLVFYRWFVRSKTGDCPGLWQSENVVFYNDRKDWYRHRAQIAPFVPPDAEQIQVALRAVDMCYVWCGFYGDGSCHSHAPLFDNVRVARENVSGPSWTYFRFELFQDNFAADGTLTGKVRIDVSALRGDGSPSDSAVVWVTSHAGIDNHVPGDINSGPAVYCDVKDVSPVKSGNIVSGNLTLYPVVSTTGGWTKLRCYNSNKKDPGPNFAMDLNDELYEPGDTLWYYFSARDKNGVTNYWSLPTGVTSSEAEVRANPIEMTCLPANAKNGVTDILYVDGFDGLGAQPFFETAFEMLGEKPDRYDALDPVAFPGSGPGARVVNVVQQLASVYKKIVFNTGYLRNGGINDGLAVGVSSRSSDDFGMLFAFLDQSPNGPGVYLTGDNLASSWISKTGAGALALRSDYMNFNLANSSHTAVGEPVSPLAIGLPGSCFDHEASSVDTVIAYGGGCSGFNDFDVLGTFGPAGVEMVYSGNLSHGAVVSQVTVNSVGDTAHVILSGFSFHEIRDFRSGVPVSRATHLAAVLRWLGNNVGDPTGISGPATFANKLEQNCPNPFNPETVISYTLRARGHVELTVYDVAGRRVKTLVSGVRAAGIVHKVGWEGRNEKGETVASGVYFYRLSTAGFVETKKMLLLK